MHGLLALLLAMLAIGSPALAAPSLYALTSHFKYSFHDTEILIPVMVNRQGPFWMKLDTGATVSVVSPKVAERAHVQVTGNSLELGAYGANIWMGAGKVAELAIGKLILKKAPCCIGDVNDGRLCDGILAGSLFHDYAVQLDFATKTVGFCEKLLYEPPPGAISVPLTFDKDHLPLVSATADGIPLTLEVDTGFSGLLELLPDTVRSNDLADKYRELRTVTARSVDATKSFGVYQMNCLGLAGDGGQVAWTTGLYTVFDSSFGPLSVSYDYDGRIGTQLLSSYTVTFDYPHSRLVFTTDKS